MADAFNPQQGLLKLDIPDKQALYAAYMPFIENGGLFVPTAKPYRIGDEVFLLVNLAEESERMPVAGRVVWVTPVGAQGKRQAGIGIQFSDKDGGTTQKKIEASLAGMLESDVATLTM
jgi:type IV pilus assembly protein PilZ